MSDDAVWLIPLVVEKSCMAGLEGRVLDRYELRKLVGRGGMADVYRSFDTKFQRDVAVKVFKREDEDLLRRFVREARLMASLRHPHLMPVFDTGMDKLDGFPYYYIVMPLMEGGTLRSRIRRTPLSLADSCRYLQEIADALDYIHSKGIIHRDIKSSNVLLDANGTAYLSDFGIARNTSDATQLTSTGNVLGTVDYVAPELFEPDYKTDARSDYYSLGVLTFEMVTGQLPFSSENQIAVVTMHMTRRPPTPSSIVPTIPPSVNRVVLRSLEKQPALRYQSATELADAFCQAIQVRGPAVGRVAAAVPQEEVFAQAPLVLPRSAAPPVATRRATRIINENDTPQPVRVPQSFHPQRPASPSTRGRIVIVFALVALLAVVGPIIYVLLGGSLTGGGKSAGVGKQTQIATKGSVSATPTATPNSTATAQVVANATQQVKNVTATAVAGVTVTAQAHASATAGVIQTATAGTVLYQDPMNNVDNPQTQQEQWQDNARCTFTTDGYQITKGTSLFNLGQIQGCLENSTRYGNMAFSVDMNIISGHSGGIFFRVSPKTLGAYAGYLFEVDSAGRYKLSKSSNFSTGTGNAILQDWTPSSAIKVGAKNTLQFIASGNTFKLYANRVFLTTVTDNDNTFTYGYIALLASTATDGGDATIVYSNLSIYKYA